MLSTTATAKNPAVYAGAAALAAATQPKATATFSADGALDIFVAARSVPAEHNAEGSLAASVFQRRFIPADHNGEGSLAAAVYQRRFQNAQTSGQGTLSIARTDFSIVPYNVQVTSSQTVPVPAGTKYIDVIVLGGGAAGVRSAGFYSWGRGGNPGAYGTQRWSTAGQSWDGVKVTIGAGGTGNNGGGGSTSAEPSIGGTPAAGGPVVGTGGSGYSQSNSRNAPGPGNKTFQGATMTGGSGNGSTPGSGGKGGADTFGASDGDPGARGEALIRFS